MKRPLRVAIDDLSALIDDYAYDCRIRPDTIELSVDPTSATGNSPWASRAAARLRAEYANCAALRRRIAKWAQQEMASDP